MADTFLARTLGLREPACDPDGTYSGFIAPRDQAEVLYWLSWWGALTGIIGIFRGWRWTGAAVCIGSLFAQMYWTVPKDGWQRALDMGWIQVLIWSHLWLAWQSPIFWIYVLIQAIGVGFYFLSWWFIKIQSSWAATITHGAVHACANISVAALYILG